MIGLDSMSESNQGQTQAKNAPSDSSGRDSRGPILCSDPHDASLSLFFAELTSSLCLENIAPPYFKVSATSIEMAKRSSTRTSVRPSPNRQLPSSVLKPIIEYSILSIDPYADLYDDQLGIQRTLLRLVSRQWNRIILRTPQLWTHIYLTLTDTSDEETLVAMYREAQTWIQRSRSLHRTLCLISPGEVDEEAAEGCDTRDALTIDPHVPRIGIIDFITDNVGWETMYIDLDNYEAFASDLFDCDPGEIPKEWKVVRTLKVKNRGEAQADPGEGEINCGRVRMPAAGFPALRDVTLNLTACTLLDWRLPWAQLTRLRLEMLVNGFEDYLDVLRKCRSLKAFHLTIGEPYSFHSGSSLDIRTTSTLIHSTLRTLVVDMKKTRRDIVPQFFDKLRLPSLATLHCSVTSEGSYDWLSKILFDSLRHLLVRSSCSLSQLFVDINMTPGRGVEEFIDEQALLRLLRTTAGTLESLSVKGYAMSCAFLISPKLTFVHLESMTIVNYSAEFDADAAENFGLAATHWVESMSEGDGVEECRQRLKGLYLVWPPYRYGKPRTRAVAPPLEERHNAEYLSQFNVRFEYEVLARAAELYGAYDAY